MCTRVLMGKKINYIFTLSYFHFIVYKIYIRIVFFSLEDAFKKLLKLYVMSLSIKLRDLIRYINFNNTF